MTSALGRRLFVAGCLLAVWLAAPASAQGGPPPPPRPSSPLPPPAPANEGLGFLIISLNPGGEPAGAFSLGSQTVVVSLGTFTGGQQVGETRFLAVDNLVIPVTFPLSDGETTLTLENLDGNQVTVIGTFQTEGDSEQDVSAKTHLVTADPAAGGISPEIEEAVYLATRATDGDTVFSDLFWTPDSETEDLSDGTPRFPTAQEICEFIQPYGGTHMEGEVQVYNLSVGEIFSALFTTNDVIQFDGLSATIEAEGDGFIHTKETTPDFSYHIAADEDGALTADVCTLVDIDVLAKKINLKSEGKLKVAILSSDTFDATDVDETTAEIGGVVAVKAKVKDVNKDGLDDLVCYFKIEELVCAGVLDECTKELTLEADLFGGACITGTDSVTVKGKDDDDCDDDCFGDDDDCGGKDKDCGKDDGKDKGGKDKDCGKDDGKDKGKDDDKGKGKK